MIDQCDGWTMTGLCFVMSDERRNERKERIGNDCCLCVCVLRGDWNERLLLLLLPHSLQVKDICSDSGRRLHQRIPVSRTPCQPVISAVQSLRPVRLSCTGQPISHILSYRSLCAALSRQRLQRLPTADLSLLTSPLSSSWSTGYRATSLTGSGSQKE